MSAAVEPFEATWLAVKAVLGTTIAVELGPYWLALAVGAYFASRSEARKSAKSRAEAAHIVFAAAIFAALVAIPAGLAVQHFAGLWMPGAAKQWAGYTSPIVAAYLGSLGHEKAFEALSKPIRDVWRRFFPERSQ